MSEEKALPQSHEEAKAWAEQVANDLAQRLVRRGVFKGHARVESRWVLPGRVFIGTAWQEDTPNQKVWVIGGEAVTQDTVELKVAEDPRAAARHFAMRWQLNGARIGSAADAGGTQGQIDYKAIEERLAGMAEFLYNLAENEQLWKDLPSAPDKGDS